MHLPEHHKSFLSKIAKSIGAVVMSKRKAVFAMYAIVVLALGLQIPSIQVDTDPENMLAADQEDRIAHNAIKEKFGLWDMLVVGYVENQDSQGVFTPDALSVIDHLTTHILSIDGVVGKDLLALSTVDNITQEGAGTIRFQWMMDRVPETLAQAEKIRESVANLPMLHNTLVSEDGKAAAIYVPIKDKSESYRISSEINAFVAEKFPQEDIHITGLPVAEDTFGVEMFIQMAISAPAAAVAIFLLMLVFFRSASLVSAPMIMAMIVVISTMGLLIGMGYTVHIMSSMIPIFLMPIAVVDSVHILSEFADRYKVGDEPKVVVSKVLQELFQPMLFTSITSAIGFASLALTPIPPVQVFGLFVAFGILLAFVMTVTFIPAYIVSLKPAALEKMASKVTESERHGKMASVLKALGGVTAHRPHSILFVFTAVVVVSVWGIQKIQINDNPVRWFQEDHDIRVADRVLNDHFAGTYEVFLALESNVARDAWVTFKAAVNEKVAGSGNEELVTWWLDTTSKISSTSGPVEQLGTFINFVDDGLFSLGDDQALTMLESLLLQASQRLEEARYFQRPEALQYIEGLQSHLASTALVGKSNSLADLVKTVYRELTADDENFKVPGTQAAVAQTLLSYQGSHRPQDLWHFVTPDFSASVIWLQLASGDNQDMEQVIQAVESYIASHPLPEGVSLNWGGLTYINVVWQEAMVNGMLESLLGSFIAVFAVMVLLFRSFWFGLLAMVPLTITIGFIYGLIGIIGKDYDMPIAVLSSLTLGLSVDFAIHFLERFRATYLRLGDLQGAFAEMFDEPARAISRNALVISLGFTPLLLAPLVPYNTVGVFLATIMAVSCAVTLLLLPALLTLLKPLIFKQSNSVTQS